MTEPGPASPASVLVIEDDHDIARAIQTLLVRAGYHATVESDGRAGLRRFHTDGPDLVILDVGLPSLDGWMLLERIRELSTAPVLMLTARGSETDKVRGLRGGADDYVTKPSARRSCSAELEAVLRRVQDQVNATSASLEQEDPSHEDYLEDGVLVDLCCHRVEVGGAAVSLTPKEFRLLEVLVKHQGSVLSTGQLLQLAWPRPDSDRP